VDVRALLESLTEQFPEPLLCVRELVQNAADAGARHISIEVAYDADRQLFRLGVTDDGRGMNAAEVEGYLTIGHSTKDPEQHRGRFGVGKLSPYALGIVQMIVDTSDGASGHRIDFDADGVGTLEMTSPREPGTGVRVYKACQRAEAAGLARRTYEIVKETCGQLPLQIEVNGTPVSLGSDGFDGPYVHSFSSSNVDGRLAICAEPVQRLSSGHILLETGAPILGESVSYTLESSLLSPTLSRNAVRRDGGFESVVRQARSRLPELESQVVAALEDRVASLRRRGVAVERHLDPDDRASVEWLRGRLFAGEPASPRVIVRAPVLETADGDLVSLDELRGVVAEEGAVPTSRTPRSPDEVSAYVARGVPVLLLYRDVEDFLETEGIRTVEVEARDLGREVTLDRYTAGERALLEPEQLSPSGARRPLRIAAVALSALGIGATAGVAIGNAVGPLKLPLVVPQPAPPQARAPAPSRPPVPERTPAFPGWLAFGGAAALAGAVGLGRWARRRRAFELPVRVVSSRRLRTLGRMLRHPRDFWVARSWMARAAEPSAPGPRLEGYRELVPEPEVPVGVRLDLDRLQRGLIDLRGPDGSRSDARIVVVRDGRALLNRNHPTVVRLIRRAETEPVRARILLDALLATEPELARQADPRQAEWDLVARARTRLERFA